MARRKRRHPTNEQKAKVPVSDLCDEYKLQPTFGRSVIESSRRLVRPAVSAASKGFDPGPYPAMYGVEPHIANYLFFPQPSNTVVTTVLERV
jgi:hypothetical protein